MGLDVCIENAQQIRVLALLPQASLVQKPVLHSLAILGVQGGQADLMDQAGGVPISRISRPVDGDLSAALEGPFHYVTCLETARRAEHALI